MVMDHGLGVSVLSIGLPRWITLVKIFKGSLRILKDLHVDLHEDLNKDLQGS